MASQPIKIVTVKPRKTVGKYTTFCRRYDPIYVEEFDSQTIQREFNDPMVATADEQQIWTIIEGDSGRGMYLVPGRQRVNRIAYVITRNQWSAQELSNPGYKY